MLRAAAKRAPDKVACLIAGTDQAITYGELDARASQVTQLLTASGLVAGDAVAIMMPNCMRYLEIVWGAVRCGLHYVPMSSHLKVEEIKYLLSDSGAKLLFIDASFGNLIDALSSVLDAPEFIVMNGDQDADFERRLSQFSADAELPHVPPGKPMCYSSGTTGRPKAIRLALTGDPKEAEAIRQWVTPFGLSEETVYLSPAPLYHAAPLRMVMRILALGGTVVVMRKFDAEDALRLIERHRVTHSQWVPTMFYRMLQLPADVRNSYDVSSLQVAIHAAAPCPVTVKQEMLAWWGDIIWEYYAASEQNGVTLISPQEWKSHPGSVGRAVLGKVHIIGEDGKEVAAGEQGDIYFDGPKFTYWRDPEKTAQSRNAQGWSTTGDIGFVDAEGYLYITDRRAHTIISGGVNIYPAEIEKTLEEHPAVCDCGVFGAPSEEFGEEVVAAVELNDGFLPSEEMKLELIGFCRGRLSGIKCPRKIAFCSHLPRLETGKLQKHVLKKMYLESSAPQSGSAAFTQ
ncbi:MAG: acyl-CoA synthetase [Sphingomonas sp.]|nr:acyl-CoA synthetase [Sphingomonas sp.]